MVLRIVDGSVLKASEPLLAHQCNVETRYARGLAEALFALDASYDVYAQPTSARRVGGVEVRRSSAQPPRFAVAALYAQRGKGAPREDGDDLHATGDTRAARLVFFRECLAQLAAYMRAHGIDAVAAPYGIGCGLAGGRMEDYLAALLAFCAENRALTVVLYDEPRFRRGDAAAWLACAGEVLAARAETRGELLDDVRARPSAAWPVSPSPPSQQPDCAKRQCVEQLLPVAAVLAEPCAHGLTLERALRAELALPDAAPRRAVGSYYVASCTFLDDAAARAELARPHRRLAYAFTRAARFADAREGGTDALVHTLAAHVRDEAARVQLGTKVGDVRVFERARYGAAPAETYYVVELGFVSSERELDC